MGRYTLYRADVDSAVAARVLGSVPGVEIEGDRDEREQEPADGREHETATTTEDGGLRAVIPETEVVDADVSAVRTYGLLGAGVSLILLGVATVGIWLYRRRGGDGETSETPPPTTELGAAAGETSETEIPAPSGEPEPPGGEPADDEGESAAEPPEPKGRTEDRSDVEWTTRDRAATDESETATDESEAAADKLEAAADESETAAGSDNQPPTEPVDAAPLLGVAFIAVTGAVVRWMQGNDE